MAHDKRGYVALRVGGLPYGHYREMQGSFPFSRCVDCTVASMVRVPNRTVPHKPAGWFGFWSSGFRVSGLRVLDSGLSRTCRKVTKRRKYNSSYRVKV